MGSKETVRLTADLHGRWKATSQVTGDGLPVPLGRLAVLGLDARARLGEVPPDPVQVIAAGVRDGLARAGLMAGGRPDFVTKAYLPDDVRERWKSSGLSLPVLIGLGLDAWHAGSMVPRPADPVDVIARLIRDGLIEAGLLDGGR